MNLGKQYIILFEECNQNFITNPDQVIKDVLSATARSKFSVVKAAEHRFEPEGLTFVLILSQSHLVVHTWPEKLTILIDIFVCNDNPEIEDFTQNLQVASGAQHSEAICLFQK